MYLPRWLCYSCVHNYTCAQNVIDISASLAALQLCAQRGVPLLFLQNITGRSRVCLAKKCVNDCSQLIYICLSTLWHTFLVFDNTLTHIFGFWQLFDIQSMTHNQWQHFDTYLWFLTTLWHTINDTQSMTTLWHTFLDFDNSLTHNRWHTINDNTLTHIFWFLTTLWHTINDTQSMTTLWHTFLVFDNSLTHNQWHTFLVFDNSLTHNQWHTINDNSLTHIFGFWQLFWHTFLWGPLIHVDKKMLSLVFPML
jgi:hypothetical protein